MPSYGTKSLALLDTVDYRLVKVCNRAIQIMDHTVITGFRSKVEQDKAFADGLSEKKWPFSMHNHSPSKAVDLAPYPIDWSDKPKAIARFYLLGGVMMAVSNELKIPIRCGWDWNKNFDPRDEQFMDLGHYELVGF